MMSELVLKGIDGANPLGFLAAVGALVMSRTFCPDVLMGWHQGFGAWRPFLIGTGMDETNFSENLSESLLRSSSEPFKVEKKLPFGATEFADILKKTAARLAPENRRCADLLTAFGSEVCVDKNVFQDTSFRMVRSGDSAGQGLPFYALFIRKATGASELYRTLFKSWDYADKSFSMRWDPLEDQRYAMRWHDPSKDKDEYAPNSMNGANALALEALSLFPALPMKKKLITTGFFKNKQRQFFFTWPIWTQAVSIEVVRSLVALQDIHQENPNREKLRAIGIMEIYRSERIAPNQYYRNFSPSMPA